MTSRSGSSASLVLLAVFLPVAFHCAGVARSVEADSWAAPQSLLATSPDGRWYVIVHPEKGPEGARFELVRRANGAKPRREPLDPWGGRRGTVELRPDKGDKIAAEGPCHMPLKVRCLNEGKGFVLFETYGSLGGRNVIERRDGAGKRSWSLGLTDLFAAEVIRARFTHSVSSVWWHVGFWVDQARGEIGLVARGKPYPGLLQVALADGKHSALNRSALLRPLTGGTTEDRVLALKTAVELDVPGLGAAARIVFADVEAPALARAHCAMYMRTQGDESGEAYLLEATRKAADVELRRYAVAQLDALLGAKAIPLLKQAIGDDDGGVQDAAEKALQRLGEPAVDTLVEMMRDASASEALRLSAVAVLRHMGHHAERALPALAALAKEKDVRLAREAAGAHASIGEAIAKRGPGK